jgi:hypothetical protein
MRLIRGAFFDPLSDQIFLLRCEDFFELRRRHQVVFIVCEEAADNFAAFGIAGQNGLHLDGCFSHIQSQVSLAVIFIGSMAGKAVVT